MKIAILLALVLFAAAGCSHKYRTDAISPPAERLNRNAAVYVMLPENGQYAGRTYAHSGRDVMSATAQAFAKYSAKVEAATVIESSDVARRTAASSGATYVIQPSILQWEDRATEWSGQPDRITIKLLVIDAVSGREVASTVARASSRWGTFGGDHPQDLLPVMIGRFADALY